MSQELQLGKYEFITYKFDDEYEKLLKELELLSLNDKEREKRRKEILKRLANFKRNQNAASANYRTL
ncbi:MAG: hypothetical protein M3Q99_00845 [Acidobacteriota bacterium]|nr:hypothetical protein [Acidobacteriota bacterium]